MRNPSINQDFQKAELRKSENANGANIFQRPLSPNAGTAARFPFGAFRSRYATYGKRPAEPSIVPEPAALQE
jgi:hypothetical protein